MKILIMVLSYNESPYRELMQAQKETWDSVEVEGIKTIYYHGWKNPNPLFITAPSNIYQPAVITGHVKYPWWHELAFDCNDDYYYMAKKYLYALNYVKDWDYDIIWRTNSSSYTNKKLLKEFAASLPTEKLYAGWEIEGNAGYNVCSGAGFFLSRDTAEILREKIDPEFEREEDVYCGQILHDAGIKIIDDKSRYDVPENVPEDIPTDRYHYRLKNPDRIHDANNMRVIHEKIIQHE